MNFKARSGYEFLKILFQARVFRQIHVSKLRNVNIWMNFLFIKKNITIRVLVTILIIASVIDWIFLSIFRCHLLGPSTSLEALSRIPMSSSILSSARSLASILKISMIGKIFIFFEKLSFSIRFFRWRLILYRSRRIIIASGHLRLAPTSLKSLKIVFETCLLSKGYIFRISIWRVTKNTVDQW